MAIKKVLDASLEAVADAIRTRGETVADLTFPNGFVSAILAIPTGGGDDYAHFVEGDQLIVNLPDDITAIRQCAFFAYPPTAISTGSCVTIPDSVTAIDSYVFNFSNLEKVIGGSGLLSIDSYAFHRSGVKEVDLSRCVNLTTIGANAFKATTGAPYANTNTGAYNNVETLDLSNCAALVSIGDNAFWRNQLTEVDFSDCDYLETIGASAFRYNAITKLKMPFNVMTSIGANAFQNNTLANQAELAIACESFGQDCFNGTTGIQKLYIQDAVTFNRSCFGNCTGLTEIHIYQKPTNFGGMITTYPVFYHCTNVTDIYVPWSSGEVPENYFFLAAENPTWHYNTV